MTTFDSYWTLDGCCYLLVDYGWLLLFAGRRWVLVVILLLQGFCTDTQAQNLTLQDTCIAYLS